MSAAEIIEPSGGSGRAPRAPLSRRAVIFGMTVSGVSACTGSPSTRNSAQTPHGSDSSQAPRPTGSHLPNLDGTDIRSFNKAMQQATEHHLGESTTNEGGDLAWGQSNICQALLRAFEATADRRYIDEFVRRADWIIAATDRARRVSDYRGRSGPVWRDAGNTASQTALVAASDAPVVQLRYAGKESSQASVTASPGTGSETFTLELSHPVSGKVVVPNVSTDPSSGRFVQSVVLREAYHPNAAWTAVPLGRGQPRPGRFSFAPLYYDEAVDSGMISYPLARFARMAHENPALSGDPALRAAAERFLVAAEDAVAFHREEWTEPNDQTAGYAAPKGAPIVGDGSLLPFNQSHAMGQTLAELFRVTRNPDYADKVQSLVRSWRAAIQHGPHGGAVWSYWPPQSHMFRGYATKERVSEYTPAMTPTRQMEDLSHGGITVEFVMAAQAARLAATNDQRILVGSYLKELRLRMGMIRGRFEGPRANAGQAAQSARWMGLGDAVVARHIHSVMQRIDPPGNTGSIVLGRAYLAWAASRNLI